MLGRCRCCCCLPTAGVLYGACRILSVWYETLRICDSREGSPHTNVLERWCQVRYTSQHTTSTKPAYGCRGSLEGVESVVYCLLAKHRPRPALQPVRRGGAQAHASIAVLQQTVKNNTNTTRHTWWSLVSHWLHAVALSWFAGITTVEMLASTSMRTRSDVQGLGLRLVRFGCASSAN